MHFLIENTHETKKEEIAIIQLKTFKNKFLTFMKKYFQLSLSAIKAFEFTWIVNSNFLVLTFVRKFHLKDLTSTILTGCSKNEKLLTVTCLHIKNKEN